MKRVTLILLFFLVSVASYGQKLLDMGFSKIRISEADKTILAEINPVNHNPKAHQDLFYYWYSANIIHSTQGGYSGQLLNGQYTEYYLNKNLKEQGIFKKGLKDGNWKDWNEDGTLNQTATWKNGMLVTKSPSPFWKKINIFKRRPKQLSTDSLAKPK